MRRGSKPSTLNNIIANYGGKAWTFLSIYLFIPLFIKFLGIEAYAVIGFYTLILGVISFVDVGLSMTVTREFAKSIAPSEKYSILLITERLYFFLCLTVGISIYFLSPFIAERWLTANSIPIPELIYYLKWIGAGVAVQLFSSVCFGGLMGLHRQVTANIIQTAWGIVRYAGAILLFIAYKPTLEVFFIWQFICNVLYVLVLRASLIRNLKRGGVVLLKVLNRLPKETWKYVGGMALIALISAVNMQADKVVTSSVFSLDQFGYYTLASTLSKLTIIVGTPIAVAIFPVFTKLVSELKDKELISYFEKFSFLLNIIIIPVGIGLCLYAQPIVMIWTGKHTFSSSVIHEISIITQLLSAGSIFLALQLIPFYLLLAKGRTKYTIWQGLAQIAFMIPAFYFFVKRWGVIGAGIPWTIIHIGAMVYLYMVIFKKELKINNWRFLNVTLFLPLLICTGIFFLFYFLSPFHNRYLMLMMGLISGVLSLLSNVAFYNYRNGNRLLDIKPLMQTKTENDGNLSDMQNLTESFRVL